MAKPPPQRLVKPPPRKQPGKAVQKSVATPAVAAKAARKAKSRARPSLGRQLGVGIAFIGCAIAALPTVALLCFALMPSMCAFMIDRHPKRYATRCVGALNIAGTWPYLLELWRGNHRMYDAMQILLDPVVWLVIYGAAAAGWLCYLSFPTLSWALMDLFAGRRIAHLRKQQRKLVDDWGEGVAKAPLQGHI